MAQGLRLGRIAGEQLTQTAVVRNVGDSPTVVTGRISYTTSAGNGGEVSLPGIRLGAGEVKELKLAEAIEEADWKNVAAAGLQFEYSGHPGSVVMSALSVSSSGNQVFRVPLVDAKGQSSSTGKYPWSIDDTASTFVYLKNTTDHPQKYQLQLNYQGGAYAPGIKTIAAGQTIAFDTRKLRDNQVPDESGHTIPLDATGGQLYWSVDGPENLTLIGRAEQVDVARGLSSTSACGTCCPATFFDGFCDPGSVTGLPGETSQFTAKERKQDCNGNVLAPVIVSALTWSSTNTAVATVDASGLATAQSPGTATIQATWPIRYWDQFSGCSCNDNCSAISCCIMTPDTFTASATCDVGPRITGPTTLWWFHGETPTGYATQITLTTSCSGTSWQWTVTSGANKVTLGTNGSCSITVTSAASSGTEGDVAITVTVAGITSDAYHLTVRAPYDLLPDIVTHQSDANFAYITHINYTIRDQFTTQLPSGVPINEQWTTGVVTDYSGMNWRRGNPTGFSASIAYFADIIQGELPSSTPTPSAPSSPLGTTAVYHWGQDWYIGSTNPGSGRRVQSNTLQKYTDHATHTNIVSPNP